MADKRWRVAGVLDEPDLDMVKLILCDQSQTPYLYGSIAISHKVFSNPVNAIRVIGEELEIVLNQMETYNRGGDDGKEQVRDTCSAKADTSRSMGT